MITIRPPHESEYEAIRRMVKSARLDPTTRLHFEHVLVAKVDGQVVGVGQIKQLNGCQELGTLFVLPEYRGQGIAAQLIAGLEARAERPLYLLCVNTMKDYYARFGYRVISVWEAPTALKRKLIPGQIMRLFGMHPWVMRKD